MLEVKFGKHVESTEDLSYGCLVVVDQSDDVRACWSVGQHVGRIRSKTEEYLQGWLDKYEDDGRLVVCQFDDFGRITYSEEVDTVNNCILDDPAMSLLESMIGDVVAQEVATS